MTERSWLTAAELAARVEKSERTVRRWVANRRHIPFRGVGQQLRFEKADVDAYQGADGASGMARRKRPARGEK